MKNKLEISGALYTWPKINLAIRYQKTNKRPIPIATNSIPRDEISKDIDRIIFASIYVASTCLNLIFLDLNETKNANANVRTNDNTKIGINKLRNELVLIAIFLNKRLAVEEVTATSKEDKNASITRTLMLGSPNM